MGVKESVVYSLPIQSTASLTFKMAGKPMKQSGSTETITLQKTTSGQRVTGDAWTSPSSAQPARPET
jgi:hypothetical protein